VCDTTVALLGDGSLAALPGGVEDYLARRAAGTAQLLGREDVAAASSRERRGDTRAARKELTRLERRVDTLSRREASLHAQLAEHATDYARTAELDAQLRDTVSEREAAEEQWLLLAEDADTG
jgi:ATP-binding cassette subfamily F protein uup